MKTRLLAVLVLAFTLSGCVPTIGNSSPSLAKDEFKKGSYPAGFPTLPLYENSKVQESYGYKGKFGSIAVTNDDISKVVQFYTDSLKPLGWDSTMKQNSATSYEFQVSNGGQQGSIIINTTVDGKKTGITISIAPR